MTYVRTEDEYIIRRVGANGSYRFYHHVTDGQAVWAKDSDLATRFHTETTALWKCQLLVDMGAVGPNHLIIEHAGPWVLTNDIPIDIVGMLTDRNPGGLYLP